MKYLVAQSDFYRLTRDYKKAFDYIQESDDLVESGSIILTDIDKEELGIQKKKTKQNQFFVTSKKFMYLSFQMHQRPNQHTHSWNHRKRIVRYETWSRTQVSYFTHFLNLGLY